MPFKHDWTGVKRDYIEGYPDEDGNVIFPKLYELAEKWNMSESTLRKKSAADDWGNERNIFRARLESARRDKVIQNLAGKASELDAGVFRVSEIALDHIKQHFIRANEKMNKAGDNRGIPMSQSQLDVLSRALERYQRVGRLALGEPTDIKDKGGEEDHDRYYIIQALVNDPEIAKRIEENFDKRSGRGDGTG